MGAGYLGGFAECGHLEPCQQPEACGWQRVLIMLVQGGESLSHAVRRTDVSALGRDTGLCVLVEEMRMVLFICFFDPNLASMILK